MSEPLGSEPVKLDLLAIGAHPDDVELCCGGTLAVLAQRGRRVGILHLTRGEAGTRGTPEQREREGRAAAVALGAVAVDFLNCGDGGLRTGRDEEDAVIAKLRLWRPEIVLGPSPIDRHPDHARGWELVEAASFYSGLARRSVGEPHRPAVLLAYMQHDPFAPTLIVDVTAGWPAKMAALDCYTSQLHRAAAPAAAVVEAGPLPPMTRVASPEFRASIEGRARHYGLVIGVEFGEPYWSRLPLAVGDLVALLEPGALR
ncbi:MAG: bacillithiol biosynthesis deacetylase BshB1 [Thermoanaerobaculia bacterium]